MIYEFWWNPDGKSGHFLADISASSEVVERMVQKYLRTKPRDSFVGFLRAHNIPALNIAPIEVGFYEKPHLGNKQILAPDFALQC